ncbi:MAG: hypothetical protein M1833_005743 [Piccolia ochrophora]|nr:MAG: hypothetical protein M1833_005743 [Piccolia ochrophora]
MRSQTSPSALLYALLSIPLAHSARDYTPYFDFVGAFNSKRVGNFFIQSSCHGEDFEGVVYGLSRLDVIAQAGQVSIAYALSPTMEETPYEYFFGNLTPGEPERVHTNLAKVISTWDGWGPTVNIHCRRGPERSPCRQADYSRIYTFSDGEAGITLCDRAFTLPVMPIAPCARGPPPKIGYDPRVQYAGTRTLTMVLLEAYEYGVLGKKKLASTALECNDLMNDIADAYDMYEPDDTDRAMIQDVPEINGPSYPWYSQWSYEAGLLKTPSFQGPNCEQKNFYPWDRDF